ncbi:MAG: hypothetical protein GY801_42310 [bacterium]|nr:hypothetical protein [bacterium]
MSGDVQTFEIVAGVDTAEWALYFPQVQDIVQHGMPQHRYTAWTVRQGDKEFTVAQNYIKYVQFPAPIAPETVSIELLSTSGLPEDMQLDLNRIILYPNALAGL